MRLGDAAEVAEACSGDALVLWGAQGMGPGVRAWTLGEAVAVACPDLNRRDRLTVCGEAGAVSALVERVLAEVGPSYRVVGSRALVDEVAGRTARMRVLGSFEWMDTPAGALPPGPADTGAGRAGWLEDAEEGEVSALLARAAPSSWAVPGVAGVRRWAGVRGDDGRLVAVAADAWSCPPVGFVAGVATAPASRGRGYGERVCRFVLGELAAAHERVALMVDTGNHAAIALYGRLGLRGRPLAAAALDGA
ncbi:GNAT family N-acetyltransferase [Streptosporangium sp. NBC_01469]|uniref:GNAT family N-acetyltransferase n=1 Tax=Streptosporangium sp. NBC_01469 TaxID=2903898 RepID=UPI002E29565E|nr:GNAT family N-acetyltransferase [Streptosporangium sp. NBC_01469]